MTRPVSAEGEREHLDIRVEEIDLEGSIDTRDYALGLLGIKGMENENVAPGPSLGVAHKRP